MKPRFSQSDASPWRFESGAADTGKPKADLIVSGTVAVMPQLCATVTSPDLPREL